MFLFLIQLASSSAESEVCHFSLKDMALPIPEPRILVVDKSGKELSTNKSERKLEFSKLNVRVPVVLDTAQIFWIPEDMSQAAIGLRVMLPADFYDRLLKGYGGSEKKWTAVNDPATSERWDDLVLFLDQIWGAKWSEKKTHMIKFEILSITPYT